MNELITLDFHGQAVAAYLIDGHQHALTDEQVGMLLGYADPASGIRHLVDRDEHGELDGLATRVKLGRVEGGREVTREIRIWGREGVIALAMLSGTETGAKVRKWARQALIDKADQINLAIQNPAKPTALLREALGVYTISLKIAKALRLEGNIAHIKALQITKDKTGVDVAELFEVKALPAETQANYLNPTDIGKRLSPVQSAREVNKLLVQLGLQYAEDGEYVGVPDHQEHWIVLDFPRLHTTGSARALRWYPTIIPLLQSHLSA